jgi:hypothetical protein
VHRHGGTPADASQTVNVNADGSGDYSLLLTNGINSTLIQYEQFTGPSSGAPSNATFTKKYLPPGAQSCSAIFNFHAPPGFDLNAIIAAGGAGGANPFAALRVVGHGGTFDFQRSISGGNTTFYSGYTDASNIAVGAYLYKGWLQQWTSQLHLKHLCKHDVVERW